jgi:hypothetical protein
MLVGSFNQNKRKEGEGERGKQEGKSDKKKNEKRYIPHSYLPSSTSEDMMARWHFV